MLHTVGFLMENGDVFGYSHFDRLFSELEKNESEISMCPKIGRHLLPKKGSQDRQKVRLAVQLLSSTTADAIKMLFPKGKDI